MSGIKLKFTKEEARDFLNRLIKDIHNTGRDLSWLPHLAWNEIPNEYIYQYRLPSDKAWPPIIPEEVNLFEETCIYTFIGRFYKYYVEV